MEDRGEHRAVLAPVGKINRSEFAFERKSEQLLVKCVGSYTFYCDNTFTFDNVNVLSHEVGVERIINNQLSLGSFIHDARIKSELTQQQLADKAGVSRKWLIGIEQGERPRAEMSKIFDVLGALGIELSLSWGATKVSSAEDSVRSGQQFVESYLSSFPKNLKMNDLFRESALQKEIKKKSGESE